MKKKVPLSLNRTGIDMSPLQCREVIEGASFLPPSSEGDEQEIAQILGEYAREAPAVGGMPPPVTPKGVIKTMAKALMGKAPNVLLDKLSERLAFERAGTRLYEALLAKLDARGGYDDGPTRGQLERFHDDELRHFAIVDAALRRLGADPTVVSPSADLHGVASSGVQQVIWDPRTSVAECLDALLTAELVDQEAWGALVDLASRFGDEQMVSEFRTARLEEQAHLDRVRRWVTAANEAAGRVLAAEQEPAGEPQSPRAPIRPLARRSPPAVRSSGGRRAKPVSVKHSGSRQLGRKRRA